MRQTCNTLSGSSAWALLDADLTQTGHKLRTVSIPNTALISQGVLRAWLHTNSKTGAVQSVPRCQLSTAALLEKLRGQQGAYDPANPDTWVAVAHFSDGLSWLVDAAGLEQLLSKVYVGAVPDEEACCSGGSSAAAGPDAEPELQMLQAYITPSRDERYITFGGVEGSTTTTHVRSYSQRYHGPTSAPAAEAAALSVLQQAQAAATAAAAAASVAAGRPSRHAASYTGSVASLSAGVAGVGGGAGVPEEYAAAAGQHGNGSGAGSRESADSGCTDGGGNYRGSCSSQVLSVDVQQWEGGSHCQEGGCDTPTLGLATAAAVDRHRTAGLFRGLGQQQQAVSPTAASAASGGDGAATVLDGIDGADAGSARESAVSCSDSLAHGPSGGSDAGCSSAAPWTASAQLTGFGGSSSSSSSSSAGRSSAAGSEGGVAAAPSRVAKAAATAVQALISYLDKALGLRVQGLVAEFIRGPSAPNQEPQLVLIGLPHLSLDPQQSWGASATFTERWGEFLAGSGPPPAPSPAQHSLYCRPGQGVLQGRAGAVQSAASMQHQSGSQQGSHAGGLFAAAGWC